MILFHLYYVTCFYAGTKSDFGSPALVSPAMFTLRTWFWLSYVGVVISLRVTRLKTVVISGVAGPTGDPGSAGPTGADGNPGQTGAPGPSGQDGNTGPSGPAGSTGQTGAPGKLKLSSF